MLRKFIIVLMSLSLCWTTLACGSSSTTTTSNQTPTQTVSQNRTQANQGEYPVQQAEYNDANGEYSLMLLNTPSGTPPTYRTTNLQMARLTDEQTQAGKGTYAQIQGDQATLYLTEDFKIQYVHNVTETRTDPSTGQQQVVVVRQQSSFWQPFAGAFVGSAIASTLFAPRYYVPPAYQPGGLTGYGGYGNTYNSAVSDYRSRYNSPPPAVKNRQVLRTTGNIASPSNNRTNRSTSRDASRSTGSGVGSSNLQRSNQTRPSQTQKRTPSFGSGSSRSRSGGSRRRR
ncbi:hypothetical protein [Lyngbya sp. PCC 8106]|uniref:hypothetical protein n=1 Tax=Lyngbya sp. (strain PCC 8106) TaxID=313612 RepID=UPI000587E033|nr:hypothetical protein [Lyngbya sp. PCC 8106]